MFHIVQIPTTGNVEITNISMEVSTDSYLLSQSLKIVFISANNADPDEMPPYAAFHLGLHTLPK